MFGREFIVIIPFLSAGAASNLVIRCSGHHDLQHAVLGRGLDLVRLHVARQGDRAAEGAVEPFGAVIAAAVVRPGGDRPVHAGRPAEALEHANDSSGNIDLPGIGTMPGTGRIGMVHVVPALAEGEQRERPQVGGAVVAPGGEGAGADHVAQRVDAPGDVLQHRVEQPSGSFLSGRCRRRTNTATARPEKYTRQSQQAALNRRTLAAAPPYKSRCKYLPRDPASRWR